MALKLTHYYRLGGHVVDQDAVVGHVREVLNSFAAKPDCSRFYVGITGDLEQRRTSHEKKKPEYTLMCVIYGEPAPVVSGSFHNLEQTVIERYRAGVMNPATGKTLICGNGQGGSTGKSWLYLLVDKTDVAGIPLYRPGSVWIDED